eukprot:gene31069-7164_t
MGVEEELERPTSAEDWRRVLLTALGSQEAVDACLFACLQDGQHTNNTAASFKHNIAPNIAAITSTSGRGGEGQGARGMEGGAFPNAGADAKPSPGGLGSAGGVTADRETSVSIEVTPPLEPAPKPVPPPTPWFFWQVVEDKSFKGLTKAYFRKMYGGIDTPLKMPPLVHLFWSFVGSWFGILLIAGIADVLSDDTYDWLVGSLGASAVLLFVLPDAKLSSPRNLVGGQGLSALVGIIVRHIFGNHVRWVSAALAMSLSAVVMAVTGTTHPPAGGTAMIACWVVVAPWEGFQYLVAVVCGSVLLLIVALIVNNLAGKRQYPTFWF